MQSCRILGSAPRALCDKMVWSHLEYPARVREGGGVTQQALSATGIMGSAFAAPVRVARTTYAVLTHPAKFYSHISLGSLTGLKRAIWYYALVLSLMTGIGFILEYVGGPIDLPDEMFAAKFWKVVDRSNVLSNIVAGVQLLSIAILSYCILRRKRIRDKINFAQYLHSILYPMAAFSVLFTLIWIIEFMAVRFLPVNYDIDSLPAMMRDVWCKNPAGVNCKIMLVMTQYKFVSMALTVVQLSLALWMAAAVGVIINSKTGIGVGRIALSFLAGSMLFGIAMQIPDFIQRMQY
jgi:hypothetical protein